MNKILEEIAELNKLENKSIPEKILKFNEEFGEFSAEVVKLLGLSHKPYDREHLVEEMADTLQVLLSTYLNICVETGDITINDILNKIPEKNQKWREKMLEYTINLK